MFGGCTQNRSLSPCIYAVRTSKSVKTLDSAALRSERTTVTHRGVKLVVCSHFTPSLVSVWGRRKSQVFDLEPQPASRVSIEVF